MLKAGDTVGIFTPSSPTFEPGAMQFSLDRLQRLGLNYKLAPNLGLSYSSYAGREAARLDDLHTLWADPEIDAMLPLRGGAGSPGLLPGIDYDLIARHPKIFCGFSDITAMLIAIHQKTGLVTFHGPTIGLMYQNEYTYDYYLKALMSTEPIGTVEDPSLTSDWSFDYPARMVIAEGSGRGRLTGGCLTLIRNLMGSEFEIDCRGRILFLEDIDEEPHTIDRMISQLMLSGKIEEAAGIVIGDCSGCKPGGSRRNVLPLNYSVETMLRERLGNLPIPVVYGLKIGHTADKVTLPLGVMASLNATIDGATFVIEEAACFA